MTNQSFLWKLGKHCNIGQPLSMSYNASIQGKFNIIFPAIIYFYTIFFPETYVFTIGRAYYKDMFRKENRYCTGIPKGITKIEFDM